MVNIFSTIKRHKIIFLIVVVVLAAAGYYFLRPRQNATGTITYNYGEVGRGTIVQSVAGTGQISAAKQSDLKSKVAGSVLGVNVSAGDKVKAGDVIARIDNDDAQTAVDDAKTALETAQLSYEKLMEPASELSLTQAQNVLDQAKETLKDDQEKLAKTYEQGFNSVASAFLDLPAVISGLQDIVTGSSSYIIQSNSTYLEYYSDAIKDADSQAPALATKAATSYRKAKTQYDKNFQDYKSLSQFSQESQIEDLITETYETTKLIAEAIKDTNTLVQRYEDILNARNVNPQSFADTQLTQLASYSSKNNSSLNDLYSSSQSITSAKSAIVNANRSIDEKTQSLENLNEAPDELDIRSQKLAILQKERALSEAIEKLEDYTITAPFDGTVASVEVDKGDEIVANAAVATVITDNLVATITLNEVDIAKVKVGQKATLTFSALEDLTMTGKVAQVNSVGAVSQGVVSYEVTIALDTENSQVKPGMSISATIITQARQNVLLVPSTAVKTANESSYVLIPGGADAAQPKQQVVTVGLSDDTNTEILEGVGEGDRIVVTSSKQTSKTTITGSNASGSNNRSFFNMGGVGGPIH